MLFLFLVFSFSLVTLYCVTLVCTPSFLACFLFILCPFIQVPCVLSDHDEQPRQDAQPLNAIFYVSFILICVLVIVNIFVAVILEQLDDTEGMWPYFLYCIGVSAKI